MNPQPIESRTAKAANVLQNQRDKPERSLLRAMVPAKSHCSTLRAEFDVPCGKAGAGSASIVDSSPIESRGRTTLAQNP